MLVELINNYSSVAQHAASKFWPEMLEQIISGAIGGALVYWIVISVSEKRKENRSQVKMLLGIKTALKFQKDAILKLKSQCEQMMSSYVNNSSGNLKDCTKITKSNFDALCRESRNFNYSYSSAVKQEVAKNMMVIPLYQNTVQFNDNVFSFDKTSESPALFSENLFSCNDQYVSIISDTKNRNDERDRFLSKEQLLNDYCLNFIFYDFNFLCDLQISIENLASLIEEVIFQADVNIKKIKLSFLRKLMFFLSVYE